MKGIILLGGHGTRLRPLTFTYAKQLLPIANKPMAFYVVDVLKNAGITDIALIVGHTEERIKNIKEAMGDGSKFGVRFTYIEQNSPRGIAHAIGLAKDFVGKEPFVAILGDNLLKGGIEKYVKKFLRSNADAHILLTHYQNPRMFGTAILEGGKLVGLIEKPKDPPSNYVMSGIYLLRPKIFEVIDKLKPSWRNELEITEAIDAMVRLDKYEVRHSIVDGWWKDTGKPEDVLEANQLVLEELIPHNKGKIKDENSTRIVGKVGIGKNTIIHEKCSIVGPVIIGDNCEIGPNVHIHPYTSIGNNCVIKNVEIEYSIVNDDVVIDGKRRRIVNSLIGRNAKIIPKAATTMEDAYQLVIGDSSSILI